MIRVLYIVLDPAMTILIAEEDVVMEILVPIFSVLEDSDGLM